MAKPKVGDTVQRDWGSGTARGQVAQVFTETVTRKIKGTEVTRQASRAEPACLIEQQDGDDVLKSGSELSRV